MLNIVNIIKLEYVVGVFSMGVLALDMERASLRATRLSRCFILVYKALTSMATIQVLLSSSLVYLISSRKQLLSLMYKGTFFCKWPYVKIEEFWNTFCGTLVSTNYRSISNPLFVDLGICKIVL